MPRSSVRGLAGASVAPSCAAFDRTGDRRGDANGASTNSVKSVKSHVTAHSNFARTPDEQYQTRLAGPHLAEPQCAWDPCDRGKGLLIDTLLRCNINAVGTGHDFCRSTSRQPRSPRSSATLTAKTAAAEMAVAFIEHALKLKYRTSRRCCGMTSTLRSPASICFGMNRASPSNWCC